MDGIINGFIYGQLYDIIIVMVRKIHGLTGCKQSEAHIQKRLGNLKSGNHPMYGKHHSEKTKRKMREAHKRHKSGCRCIACISRGKKGKESLFWGKHHTDETKEKISLAFSTKRKEKMSTILKKKWECPEYRQERINQCIGGNNPFYGKEHTKKSKEKQSEIRKLWWENPINKERQVGRNHYRWTGGGTEYTCFYCGEKFQGKHSRKKSRKKTFCSAYCYHTWSSGRNSPVWKGGISKFSYPSDFNNELKNKIRMRDNHECQLCGMKQINLNGHRKYLPVHHIDYNKSNNKDNFITLCYSCNAKANHDRDKWSFLFDTLNEIRMTEWRN